MAVQTMLLRVIITLAHTHVPVLWATGQTTKTAVKVTLKNISIVHLYTLSATIDPPSVRTPEIM